MIVIVIVIVAVMMMVMVVGGFRSDRARLCDVGEDARVRGMLNSHDENSVAI